MRKYLYSETGGFVEKNNWLPNCWVNVECPTDDDFNFLREDLKVPTSFLNDIADTDERPYRYRRELATYHFTYTRTNT